MNKFIPVFVFLACSVSKTAFAATISWSGPFDITGDLDVLTTGTLVGALRVQETGARGSVTWPPVMVNGVPFGAIEVDAHRFTASAGAFDLVVDQGRIPLNSEERFGTTSGPFSNLSGEYQAILVGAMALRAVDFLPSITLTISGLTIGQQYAFQWWANDPRGGAALTQSGAVTLRHSAAGTPGSPGQFAIGTFTADGAEQRITFQGGPVLQTPPLFSFRQTQINAMQLRAVPEPSVAFLGGAGVLGLAACRRNRRGNTMHRR